MLIFAPRGSGKSASGGELTPVIAMPKTLQRYANMTPATLTVRAARIAHSLMTRSVPCPAVPVSITCIPSSFNVSVDALGSTPVVV